MTSERELLTSHKDVERLVDLPVVEYVDRTEHALEVWFEDELHRTEDPTLLALHKERQTLQPRPPISPARLAKALETVSVPVANPFREALRAQLESHGLGELLRPLPPHFADVAVSAEPDPRGDIIARAISTSEGRSRLAAAMAMPIRRNIEYGRLARSMMPVDQLPPVAATYWASGSVIPLPPSPPEITPEEIQRSMGSLGITPMMDQGDVGSATVSGTQTLYSLVRGYDVPEPPGMFQPLQTGTMGTYIQASYNGVARVDGLSGMSPGIHIGCILEIGGSLYPGNNGRFHIIHVFDSTSVMISNHTAMVDSHVGLTWAVWNPQAIPQANDRVDTFGDWRTATGASLNHFASTMGLVRLPYESDEALRNRLVIALSPYSATPTDWGHIVEEYNTPTKIPNESAPRRTGWNRLLEDDED